MNHLAHFYLSGNNDQILAGNFIADAVKGKQVELFSGDLKKGILMHRQIDFFTDHHPVTSRSKDLLRGEFNHYSGVILDVFYDHFLAKNWKEFSAEPLEDYAQRIYSVLQSQSGNFPERPGVMLEYMRKNNWLVAYSEIDGIRKALTGMSQRTKFNSKMEFATDFLIRDYNLFEKDFREFFPEIILHTTEFRNV